MSPLNFTFIMCYERHLQIGKIAYLPKDNLKEKIYNLHRYSFGNNLCYKSQ